MNSAQIAENATYLLDKYFATSAAYKVHIDRDRDDEYTFVFDRLQSSARFLDRSEVLRLIPTGSHWSYLLGWRSFFGIPIMTRNSHWLVLGVETAAPHPSRGSYLVYKAYIFPFPLANDVQQKIRAFANEISSQRNDISMSRTTFGRIDARSQTLDAHRRIEGRIVRVSLQQYEKKVPFRFQTLATRHEQLEQRNRHQLVALVPAVAKHFPGRPTRSWGCLPKATFIILTIISVVMNALL